MRKYEHRTTIELDESTRKNLEKQCKKYKKTKAKFLRDLINKRASHKKIAQIYSAIQVFDHTFLTLHATANNINQIAHNMHIDRMSLDEEEFLNQIALLTISLSDLKMDFKLLNRKLKGVI